MKKFIYLLTTMTFVFIFTNCGKDDGESDEENDDGNTICVFEDWLGSYSGGCQGETIDVEVTESTNSGKLHIEVNVIGDGVTTYEASLLSNNGCRAKIETYPLNHVEIILKGENNELVFDFVGSVDIPCSFLKVYRN